MRYRISRPNGNFAPPKLPHTALCDNPPKGDSYTWSDSRDNSQLAIFYMMLLQP